MVNGAGLVGKVTWVSPGTSIVTLVTDHTTQIGATVSESGVKGIVQVEAGHPTDLVLGSLSGKDVVRPRRDRRHLGHGVEGRQVPLALSAGTSRSAA